MTEKITSLTPEQEIAMEAFYEECKAIHQSTDPVDKDGASKWISEAYKATDLASPQFLFVPSPKAAKKLIADCGKSEHLKSQMWGCHEIFWQARYLFARQIGVKFDKEDDWHLTVMFEISKTCMWWWPFTNYCIVSDRPENLHFDEQERLHNPTGMAIKFRDGFGVSCWHDVTVPDEWLTDPGALTPKIALAVENVEQRRAACEIIGWDKVLDDPSLNPVVIDQDEPHIGTLMQVDLPDAPEQWFLKYRCGTGRYFAEPVTDKSFNTALKANAGGNGWRGQGDPESFIPFART